MKQINYLPGYFISKTGNSRFGKKRKINLIMLRLFISLIAISGIHTSKAQMTQIPAGSFIVNMGVTPQTVANGLKPYGLIYALLQAKVPVDWVINPTKSKDGIDFNYAGVDYKGGAFIIRTAYRNAFVNSIISTWQAQGVVGVTTTTPILVPLNRTLYSAPRWTMDQQNGKLAVTFFTNAGIPSSAYGGSSSTSWKTPAMLNCCDDIFVMPHADPTWATHGHLYEWVLGTGNGTTSGCKGAVWLGCHAGSALENMFKNTTPVDYSMQTNFLCEKTGNASGAGPYFENALVLWGNHDDGTLPYSYDFHADPVAQFIGTLDAATLNGSEQVYIPKGGLAGWRPKTKVITFDPDHPQRYNLSNNYEYRPVIVAYGPAFSDTINGNIMLEACHNIAASTAPANVAAQRAFFNFSFLTSSEETVFPVIAGVSDTLYSGSPTVLSYTIQTASGGGPVNTYTAVWNSGCGGVFSPGATSNPATYTPPNVSNPTNCVITLEITDPCGRTFFDSHATTVLPCALSISTAVTPPSCYGNANGSIAMTISGGSGPYTYSWTRTNPAGTGSGSGTSITGLAAGTYQITVTNAAGCSGTVSTQLTQPSALTLSATPSAIQCFGNSNGTISLNATGGSTPYMFDWADLPGTNNPQNRSALAAGLYSVTLTDVKGCIANTSATVIQPASGITVNGIAANVGCSGGSNGSIDLTVIGGQSPYTYNWGNGITSEDRSNLPAGNYVVIVTDNSGCSAQKTFAITQPDALAVTGVITHPTCPPSAHHSNNDGSIDLTVTGGSSPFSYYWTASNGGVIPSGYEDDQDLIHILVAGMYTVTVTDHNGCTKVASFSLDYQNPLPVQPDTITN